MTLGALRRVLVAGWGVTGRSVAEVLTRRGVAVTIVDAGAQPDPGFEIVSAIDDLSGYDLVVTSPGWRPDHPLFALAQSAGIEVIGDIELAWRVDQERSAQEGGAAPRWLALTGTNGKTTSVGMLASILKAAGIHSVAAGNVGLPLIDAVIAEPRYEVIAIELSSFQLHWCRTIAPHAGALINIAEDHLDWHGSMDAYAEAKCWLLHHAEIGLVNLDDPLAVQYSRGIQTIGVTRDIPRPGELGLVEDLLVDRAFCDPTQAEELATLADLTPAAPHNITNALIASALARTIGVHPSAVAEGLRSYRSDGHRIELVARFDDVDYVDDSKATNPHAAAASIGAFDSVIWIAGGLAKGAAMDELVESVAGRLRGAVLIGTDREIIAKALARHAPQVPVVRVEAPDTEQVKDDLRLMRGVIAAARGLATQGDTVLLAPACASMDQFTSYAHRGNLFAEAVRELQ